MKHTIVAVLPAEPAKRIVHTRTRFCKRTGVKITNTVEVDVRYAPTTVEHITMETPT